MMRVCFLNPGVETSVNWKKVVCWIANFVLNLILFSALVILFGGVSDFVPSVQDVTSIDVNLTILALHIALLSIVIAVSAFIGFFSLERAIEREVKEQIRRKESHLEALIESVEPSSSNINAVENPKSGD